MHLICRITLFLPLQLTASTFFGQISRGPSLNIKAFTENCDIAKWLCRYDAVAWRTSDSAMAAPKEEIAKAGSEWFCFETKDGWRATYGKYINGNYAPGFYYKVDTNDIITRIIEPLDTQRCNSYSRALINAKKYVKPIRDSIGLSFNEYIRREADKTISVWILPALQENGQAIYGGEFHYRFDSTGNTLVFRDEQMLHDFRNFVLKDYKLDKTESISLDYREIEQPTLGAIFFVFFYQQYFKTIRIVGKYLTSQLFWDGKQYTWIHADKK